MALWKESTAPAKEAPPIMTPPAETAFKREPEPSMDIAPQAPRRVAPALALPSVVDVRVSVTFAGTEPLAATWMNDAALPQEAAMSEDALRRVAREIERPGLTVSTNVLIGDPKRVLVEESDAWKADCVFVGAKGHSRLERVILGSVSAAVATRAHCSVEIVRGS